MTVFRGNESAYSGGMSACCIQKRRGYLWASSPLYIEEIRAYTRRRPTEAADGRGCSLEGFRKNDSIDVL